MTPPERTSRMTAREELEQLARALRLPAATPPSALRMPATNEEPQHDAAIQIRPPCTWDATPVWVAQAKLKRPDA